MGEGTVLTVVASLTGFLLYLPYALKEGLAKGQTWVESTESYWVSDFTSHYLLVDVYKRQAPFPNLVTSLLPKCA